MNERNRGAPLEEAGGGGQENWEEDNDFVSEEEAAEIKAKNDPRRMRLTQDEWERAYEVKKEFLDPASGLDTVSDYWCAQLAMVGEGLPGQDLTELVGMAKGTQTFKREFDIRDTPEEGCRALQRLVELAPQMFLHFGFEESEGTFLLAQDGNGCDFSIVNSTPRNFNAFMVGMYYMLHAATCDMDFIRKGTIIHVDCTNVGWSRKNDYKTRKQVYAVLFARYPVAATGRHINAGVIFNLLFGIAKKVLPHGPGKRIQFQNSYNSDVALSDFYLVPTVEAANERLVASLQESLRKRYQNEKRFSLYR